MVVIVFFADAARMLIFVLTSAICLTACGGPVYETPAVSSGGVTLVWDSPTRNTDGSKLLDLAGYWIFCTPETGPSLLPIQVSDPLATQHVVDGLSETRWSFEISAYNSLGYQSARSSTISTLVVVD